jgi:hypothetical protein
MALRERSAWKRKANSSARESDVHPPDIYVQSEDCEIDGRLAAVM